MIRQGTFHLDLSGIGAQPLKAEDPEAIGGFPLVAVLGEGGMGRVYLAVTPRGYGAVKRIVPGLATDRQFLERFEHELDNQARMPAGVSARVLATDKTAQPPWFVTEYIPGLTLHDAVYGEGGSLPPSSVWRLLHELASRLKIVHAFDVTHRDLKPSNVILTADGCRIIDFGIARAADQSPITVRGQVIGTPRYMAPEQASGDGAVGSAADVYALAATVVFAATGLPPFGEASGDVLRYWVMNKDPDLDAVRELDAELADVLAPCFDRNPAARPSAAALAERAGERAAQARAWPTQTMAGIYQRKAFAEAFRPIAPQSTSLETVGTGGTGRSVGAGDAVGTVGTSGTSGAVGTGGDPAIDAGVVEPASGSGSVIGGSTGSSVSAGGSDPVDPPRSEPLGEPEPKKRPRKQRRKLLIVPLVLTVTAGTGTATYLLTKPTPSTRDLSSVHSSTPTAGTVSSSTSAKPTGSASPTVTKSASATSTTQSADTNTAIATTQSTSTHSANTITTAAQPAGAAPHQMAKFNYNYPNYCFGACDPFPVLVSWASQSDATSYDIHYRNTTRNIDQVINVKGTSYTINTTNSGDHYCLSMRADNQYGDSIWQPTSDSSNNCFDVPY